MVKMKNMSLIKWWLFFILLFGLVGCSSVKGNSSDSNGLKAEESNELYSRIAIEVSEGEIPLHIAKTRDENLYVVTGEKNVSKKIWCVDKKDNWIEKYDLVEMLNMDKSMYCEAFVLDEGEVLIQYNRSANSKDRPFLKGKIEYMLIDKSGNVNMIDLKLPELKEKSEYVDSDYEKDTLNYISDVKANEDSMYLMDGNSEIFEFNKNDNSLKCVYENADLKYISDFCVCDKTLIMQSEDEIYYKGVEASDDEEKAKGRFGSFFENPAQKNQYLNMDEDNGKLWTVAKDKIGRYDLEKDSYTIIKVIGTNGNEIINSQITIDGVMYALVYGFSDDKMQLCKYVEGTDNIETSTVSDAKSGNLKIWILGNPESYSETVRCFTDKYPNVKVEVENGFSDDNVGITRVDAIKNLNTEILAGNGPDIIYMTGLDIDKYIESDGLYDITDVVDELKASGDYFNNILDTYAKDGKNYAVPSGVSLMSSVGTKEDIEAAQDIVSFGDYIESEGQEQTVIDQTNVPSYIVYMYYKDIRNDLLNGNIDREKIKSFFLATKKIYDSAVHSECGMDPLFMIFPSNNALYYENHSFLIASSTGITWGPMALNKLANENGGVVNYPAKDFENMYAVTESMAISSKAVNIDNAKEYIKIALGEECQSAINTTSGFKVNRKGLANCERSYFDILSAGEYKSFLNEADFDKYLQETIKYLETVNEPINVDYIFDDIMIGQLNDFVYGDVTLDSAVDSTIEKIQLYLSE